MSLVLLSQGSVIAISAETIRAVDVISERFLGRVPYLSGVFCS